MKGCYFKAQQEFLCGAEAELIYKYPQRWDKMRNSDGTSCDSLCDQVVETKETPNK